MIAAASFSLPQSERDSWEGYGWRVMSACVSEVYATAAYPHRRAVTVDGDDSFAMLMAELSTAVAHNLSIRIILLKNNSLAEVNSERWEIGNPKYSRDLAPIDFMASEVRPANQAALNSGKARLVAAVVAVNEKPAKPDELKD